MVFCVRSDAYRGALDRVNGDQSSKKKCCGCVALSTRP
jgi:hypothetical protein